MAFDPDKYLATQSAPPPSGFDPDAYLASKEGIPGARTEITGEIRPTPQNPILGAAAAILRGREAAEKGMGPSISRTVLSSILPTAEWMERKSYGDVGMRMPPAGTGGYIPVMTDKPYVAETIGVNLNMLPLGRLAAGAFGREAALATRLGAGARAASEATEADRKSTRLNSSH